MNKIKIMILKFMKSSKTYLVMMKAILKITLNNIDLLKHHLQ